MFGKVLRVAYNEANHLNYLTLQSGRRCHTMSVTKDCYDQAVKITGRSLWGLDVVVRDGLITVED